MKKQIYRECQISESSSSCVLRKRCSETTQQINRKHPHQIPISIKLQGIFAHIFRTPFPKNTSEGLLLKYSMWQKLSFDLQPPSIRLFFVSVNCNSTKSSIIDIFILRHCVIFSLVIHESTKLSFYLFLNFHEP